MQRAAKVPLYMVLMNYLPLLFLLVGTLVSAQQSTLLKTMTVFLIWLYLIPPLICRLSLKLLGSPVTEAAKPHERSFRLWWFFTQLQMPFNRISLLEEMLRLVPGLYSLWLNLWGGRVSLLTFWTRDVLISERYLLTIEPGVTIASQTGISAHLVNVDDDGKLLLVVAPVVIERGAIVGVRCALGPGCRVFAGEVLPAGRMLPPHSGWKLGRKVKLDRG